MLSKAQVPFWRGPGRPRSVQGLPSQSCHGMVEMPHGVDFSFSFRAQVAEERRLGLTPALHMDAKDERVQCQLEINFIDCVVTPLWEHMAHCFPALQPCMERLRANRAAYAALAQCSAQEVAQVPHLSILPADSPCSNQHPCC